MYDIMQNDTAASLHKYKPAMQFSSQKLLKQIYGLAPTNYFGDAV